MIKRLSSRLVNLFRRPTFPLALLCVSIITTTALAAVLVFSLLGRNQDHWTSEYGQALANLAAHRALDSTLNHDLVSLQVILSDVAENASVTNATIHDVENNLLVQAGQRNTVTPAPRKHLVNFTAPITLHNSIAGYVTVALDLNNNTPIAQYLLWLFSLMAATLMALTLCYVYFTGSGPATAHDAIPIVTTPNVTTPNVTTPNFTGHLADNDEVFGQSAVEDRYHVQLVIGLLNYQDLSKQLNSKSFRGVNQRLEQQLIGIMALYSGRLIHIEQAFARIQFGSNESSQDAIFKGLCAALLIQQLNQQLNQHFNQARKQQHTSIPLQLNFCLIDVGDTHTILKHLPYYLAAQEDIKQLLLQAGEHKILAEAQLLEDAAISSRLTTATLANYDDIVEVVSVQDNYQSLLDKQLQQLSKNI